MKRFWSKVDVQGADECWLWTAYVMPNGYGTFGRGGRAGGMVLAHRFAYELTFGPIPDGLVIDHLCGVTRCVNPAHLEAVTQRVNVMRGSSKIAAQVAQTECLNGHPFTPENTRYYHEGSTKRTCLACARDRMRRRRAIGQNQ